MSGNDGLISGPKGVTDKVVDRRALCRGPPPGRLRGHEGDAGVRWRKRAGAVSCPPTAAKAAYPPPGVAPSSQVHTPLPYISVPKARRNRPSRVALTNIAARETTIINVVRGHEAVHKSRNAPMERVVLLPLLLYWSVQGGRTVMDNLHLALTSLFSGLCLRGTGLSLSDSGVLRRAEWLLLCSAPLSLFSARS